MTKFSTPTYPVKNMKLEGVGGSTCRVGVVGWRGYTYIPYQMGPKTARRAYLHTLSDVPQIYPPPWIPEPSCLLEAYLCRLKRKRHFPSRKNENSRAGAFRETKIPGLDKKSSKSQQDFRSRAAHRPPPARRKVLFALTRTFPHFLHG